MQIFYIEVIAIFIFSLYARLYFNKNEILSNVFVFTVIIILSVISGLRSGSIGDTGMYTNLYKLIGPDYSSNGAYEPGFILFLKLLKSISQYPQFMLIITSIIINVFNIWTIKSFPGYFELSTFLYITSGYYLVTMNGLRQSLAAAVVFACTNLIIKGKFKTYLLMIILMYTIHSSALILIPVYFLVRSEAWSKRIYIFILLLLIGLIIYGPMMNIFFNALGDTKYGQYKDFNEGGANIFRVFIFAVPVILSIIKRTRVKEQWAMSKVFVNMALLNLIIMCFALNNWIFARLTVYFELYNFVLMSYIIRYCAIKKERNLLYFTLIIGYTFFFWYDQAITMHIQYKTFMSP